MEKQSNACGSSPSYGKTEQCLWAPPAMEKHSNACGSSPSYGKTEQCLWAPPSYGKTEQYQWEFPQLWKNRARHPGKYSIQPSRLPITSE